MDVPEPVRKRAAMTFDMLEDIHKAVTAQPDKCELLMDKKIKTNNKLRRKYNIGQGGGAGAIILAIGEGIKALLK